MPVYYLTPTSALTYHYLHFVNAEAEALNGLCVPGHIATDGDRAWTRISLAVYFHDGFLQFLNIDRSKPKTMVRSFNNCHNFGCLSPEMKKTSFASGKYLVFVWIFYLQGIFTPTTCLVPHADLMRERPAPFFRWENRSTERLSKLLKGHMAN